MPLLAFELLRLQHTHPHPPAAALAALAAFAALAALAALATLDLFALLVLLVLLAGLALLTMVACCFRLTAAIFLIVREFTNVRDELRNFLREDVFYHSRLSVAALNDTFRLDVLRSVCLSSS